MNDRLLKIISALIIACTVISFASCKSETDTTEPIAETTAEKSVTSETVKIVTVPTDTSELIDMLNNSISYVDKYCYNYTKSLKCTASVDNIGSLTGVSNASAAFASIFGEQETEADYDYKADQTLFADNFVKGSFAEENISSISASLEDNIVVLKAELNDESNPTDESGILCNLGGDYISADKINSSLAEFDSSASSINVSADSITITAKISVDDSSLQSMTVSYTERFSLSGVTLVQVSGGAVSGSSTTVIEYTDFG